MTVGCRVTVCHSEPPACRAVRLCRRDAERLGDVVKFHWEAVAKDGEVFGVGLNFLVIAADGRIERDYTFVVA